MQGRMKNLFLLKIFSSSTFVCLYFLFFDHKHFSLSIRIDHEDNIRKPANKIINISRRLSHGSNSFDQLMLHILKNYSGSKREAENSTAASLSLNLDGQTRLERFKIRSKRGFHSLSSENGSNFRLERSLSRQQKLGPIFYQEPPSTYFFSNDTGKLYSNILNKFYTTFSIFIIK